MLKDNIRFKNLMNRIIFLVPLLIFGMGMAYAEPLEHVQTSVLNYTNSAATVEITWNEDENVSSYQIGCVSCFPNTVESTTENNVLLNNVTAFPNGSIAVLYGLAFDFDNEIIAAKQIILNLTP